MLTSSEMFMQEAIRQAAIAAEKDEVPVGAVIVIKNRIIAKAHNQVELLKDPTAHAEMIAITQAASAIGQKWLNECEMYVTLEPCSMCAGAMVLARLKKLYFGAYDPKAGAVGSVTNVLALDQLNHRVEVSGGCQADICGGMLSEFFLKKRGKSPI